MSVRNQLKLARRAKRPKLKTSHLTIPSKRPNTHVRRTYRKG